MPHHGYQPSFTGGELAPSLYARTDLAKYATGLRTCLNFLIAPHGGAVSRPGFEFIAELKESGKVGRLIPFAFSTTQTYMLVFEHNLMRVIKDGAAVVETGKTITGITQANPAVVTAVAHGYANGDDVEIADVVGMTEVNGRRFRVANKTTDTFELSGVTSAAYTAYASGGTVSRVYTLVTTYTEAELPRLGFTQSADTLYLVHPSHAPAKLTRTGHAAWTLSTITFQPATSAPTGQSATPTGSGGTAATVTYKVTAISDETGEESLPSGTASCTGWTEADWPAAAYVTVTFSAVTGCTQYKVYKDDNGIYGYIGVTESLSFKDDNISADVSDTPPGARDPFNGAGKYPSTAAFFEQRLYYGATSDAPQTVWGSNINSFNNFNVGRPAGDDEAITFTMAAAQVNEVRHIVPLQDMILLTSGGEWRVAGAGDAALSPTTITIKPQSYRGAARLRPLVIGDTIIFVQAMGSTVRDLAYRLESDGFTGNDLSILSNHLFDGYTITDWAYAQTPHSIIWAVRSDGVLLGLTYLREHEVWAWHRHVTDGTFEAVATVSEGQEDAVYVIVNRTIGGQTKRYVERLHSRRFTEAKDYFGVDSGLTYSGSATATVTGLHHLEGETVAVFADGDVVTPVVVSGGSITLPRAYTTVHAGLPYACDLETLDIDVGSAPGGTIQGKRKSVARVTVRVEKSREFQAGPSADRLLQTKMNLTAYDAGIAAHTGDVEITLSPTWNSNGRVFIRQSNPAPLSVLAIMPVLEVGG